MIVLLIFASFILTISLVLNNDYNNKMKNKKSKLYNQKEFYRKLNTKK